MSPGQFLSWQSCTWLPSPGQPSPTSSFTQTLAYKCSIYMIVKGKRSMTNVVPIQYFGLQIAEILTLLFCPHPQVSVQLPQADQDVHPERILKRVSQRWQIRIEERENLDKELQYKIPSLHSPLHTVRPHLLVQCKLGLSSLNFND